MAITWRWVYYAFLLIVVATVWSTTLSVVPTGMTFGTAVLMDVILPKAGDFGTVIKRILVPAVLFVALWGVQKLFPGF